MIKGFKIGFLTSDIFSEQDFLKTCSCLTKTGYDAIEPTAQLFSPRTHSSSELTKMMRVAENSGLEISEVIIQKDYLCKNTEEKKEALCYTLDCLPYIRI